MALARLQEEADFLEKSQPAPGSGAKTEPATAASQKTEEQCVTGREAKPQVRVPGAAAPSLRLPSLLNSLPRLCPNMGAFLLLSSARKPSTRLAPWMLWAALPLLCVRPSPATCLLGSVSVPHVLLFVQLRTCAKPASLVPFYAFMYAGGQTGCGEVLSNEAPPQTLEKRTCNLVCAWVCRGNWWGHRIVHFHLISCCVIPACLV